MSPATPRSSASSSAFDVPLLWRIHFAVSNLAWFQPVVRNITIIGDHCRFELAKDAKAYKDVELDAWIGQMMENVTFDRGWLDQPLPR